MGMARTQRRRTAGPARLAGTGRRAMLKPWCPKGREGSTPSAGTLRDHNVGGASMDNAPDGIHLATITIALATDGDREYVHVEADEGTTAITMLGMLHLAQSQILDRLT